MRSSKKVIAIVLTLLLTHTMMLSATEQNKKIETTYPMASAILLDAYRYLGALDHFTFNAITTNDDVYRNLMLQEFTHKLHVDLQRPDKLQIHVSGDIKNRSFYLLNDTYNVIDHNLNFYGELKVPKTIDSALDYLFEKYGIKSPLANLLYTDLDKRIAPKKRGYYFGTSIVDAKVCHYIGFVNAQRELQLWIEKGKTPFIRKFSIIDKSGKFDIRSTTLLRWNTKLSFKKNHFVFKAPKDAKKISVEPTALKGGK